MVVSVGLCCVEMRWLEVTLVCFTDYYVLLA